MLRGLAELLAGCVARSHADPLSAATEAVRVLMEAAGADNGYVVLGIRLKGRPRKNEVCPLHGYRAAFYRRVYPLPPEAVRLIDQMVSAQAYVDDPMTAAVVANAHRPWAARLREVAPANVVRAYLKSPLARALGAKDTIRANLPLGREGFVTLGLDRTRATHRFRAADRDRVLDLLPALSAPFFRLGMFHGLVDGRALLSPREVEVYRLLLTPQSEKEIAYALGITPNRVHELVLSVFTKLGVAGRNGLWRHWLAPPGLASA